MQKQQGVEHCRYSQHYKIVHGIFRRVVPFGIVLGLVAWLQLISVYAWQRMDKVNQLPAIAREAKLSHLYLPKNTVLNSNIVSVSHDSSGIIVVEFPDFRLMESVNRISLDEPNEREKVTELPPGVQSAMMETYLLPGGTIQQTMSLCYDGMYVTLVPKWTSPLKGSGRLVPKNEEAASLRQAVLFMAVAKTLQKIELN